jgi:hypothetical protein
MARSAAAAEGYTRPVGAQGIMKTPMSGRCSGSIKLDTVLRGEVHSRNEDHHERETHLQSRI